MGRNLDKLIDTRTLKMLRLIASNKILVCNSLRLAKDVAFAARFNGMKRVAVFVSTTGQFAVALKDADLTSIWKEMK